MIYDIIGIGIICYISYINNHSDHASLSEVVKGYLSIFYDGNQAMYLMIALYFKSIHT